MAFVQLTYPPLWALQLHRGREGGAERRLLGLVLQHHLALVVEGVLLDLGQAGLRPLDELDPGLQRLLRRECSPVQRMAEWRATPPSRAESPSAEQAGMDTARAMLGGLPRPHNHRLKTRGGAAGGGGSGKFERGGKKVAGWPCSPWGGAGWAATRFPGLRSVIRRRVEERRLQLHHRTFGGWP